MESWNQVIHTALLGTEKKTLQKEEVDEYLAESLDLIAAQTVDKEEAFLQTASLVYNARQCGTVPLKKETIFLPQAEPEEKPYASPAAHAVLSDILDTGSTALFQFWLEQCSAANKIVKPDFLPYLLNTATRRKELRHLVKACGGKRGEWLVQFNEEWKWNEAVNEEEIWETGTLAQRKAFLSQQRLTDSTKGRELLQQTWSQEPVNIKAELLEAMLTGASNADVLWLEELLNEKSVKVKEATLQVLKTIPSSSIVQTYWTILKDSIRLATSKGILGIGSKTTLDIKLAAVDPTIFKTGIEQVSSEKGVSDEAFILYQLAESVPPRFWEEYFNLNREEILKLFSKDDTAKSLIPAIGTAAAHFRDIEWLRAIITIEEKNLYLEALDILPQKEAEAYAVRFFTHDDAAASTVQNLHLFKDEWTMDFTKAFLRFTGKNGYQYHRGFYNEIIHLFPVPIIGELEKCTPKEEYQRTMWAGVSEHITKLLTLKLQTLKAFNE